LFLKTMIVAKCEIWVNRRGSFNKARWDIIDWKKQARRIRD
jgi:hypothetical protein